MSEETQDELRVFKGDIAFASGVQIVGGGNDFTLIFSRLRPAFRKDEGTLAVQEPTAVVALSPQTLKDLSLLIAPAIVEWEAEFGEIKSPFSVERSKPRHER